MKKEMHNKIKNLLKTLSILLGGTRAKVQNILAQSRK